MNPISNASLHKVVGSCLKKRFHYAREFEVLLAPECCEETEKRRTLSLFCAEKKGRDTRYRQADILVLVNGAIGVVVEIDGIKDPNPSFLMGRVAATAMCRFFIYGNLSIPFSPIVLFVQILNRAQMRNGSKLRQFVNIERDVNEGLLKFPGSSVSRYNLICGLPEDFADGGECHATLVKTVGEALS